MVLIIKSTTNKIIVTLKEKQTLAVPVFLFRLVSDVDNKEYSFILADISVYKDRYNEFDFIEGTTAILKEKGFYHYYIYEQTSAVNLDYTLTTTLLEVGKLEVTDNSESVDTVSYSASPEYISYN